MTDHRTLTRPVQDASPAEVGRYRRQVAHALSELGIEFGEEFIVMRASDFQQQKSLEDLDGELGPFAKDSETSRKAALANYPRSGSQRHRILSFFAAQLVSPDKGRAGYTREQLERSLHLSGNTIRPRVQELIEGGFLAETDRTRQTSTGSDAAVLRLTDHGQAEIRAHFGHTGGASNV